MVIQTSTQEVSVKFARVALNGVKGFKCTLSNPVTILDSPVGTSFCSPKDKWNAAKGKKVAFSRALDAAGFSKEERTEIWDEYLGSQE